MAGTRAGGADAVAAGPICPPRCCPTRRVPSEVSATACVSPAAMRRACGRSAHECRTAAIRGVALSQAVPCHSSPTRRRARSRRAPAKSASPPRRPRTGSGRSITSGTDEYAMPATPSWPRWLLPHPHTMPSPVTASACVAPAAIELHVREVHRTGERLRPKRAHAELARGIAAPCMHTSVFLERQHAALAERGLLHRTGNCHRARPRDDVRRRATERPLIVQPPGVNDAVCTERGVKEIARDDSARRPDLRHGLRGCERCGRQRTVHASGAGAPHHHLAGFGDPETHAVAGRDRAEGVGNGELDRMRLRLRRAAVFRSAACDAAAAVASPSEHSSRREECQRMIATAADRDDGMA